MSNSIDERIVNMQFNNKQFESGISTSLSSIEKLKKGMDFDGATKSLSGLSDAGKKFSLAGIAEGVEQIAGKFSALGIMGVTALQNITNSAINAGKRIVSALTIDPVTTGFSEYELKMNSVQTIMAGTGENLDTVMEKLNELNVYADKTIYSFSDMTSNIGKFTNAGVSLEQSVAAIQGVANVAAVSGANANEASRAMYNFAQALSSGYVKLIDWKSIELANMGTVEFKQQLIDAAVAAGTLTKAADGMYTTLEGNAISATQGFNDSLQDQWMTTDVLVNTLNQYADETTDIGKKATAAAQDIKTLTQMYDTLKESAGSGWAETWEIIAGNYDEAKLMYTELGNALSDIIQSSADARNEMLQTWKDEGGREDLIQSFRNLGGALKAIVTPIKEAFREIFPALTGTRLAEITKSFKEFTERLKIGDDTAAKIRSTFKGLFSILNIGKNAFLFLARGVKSFIQFLAPAAKGLLTFTGSIGDWLTGINDSLKKSDAFNKAFEKLRDIMTDVADKVQAAFKKLADAFTSFTGIDLSSLDAFVATVKEKFHPLEAIGNFVRKAIEVIGKVFKWVGPIFSKVGKTIGTAFSTMNFQGLIQLFTTGTFAAAILGIKNLVGSFKTIADSAGGFLKGITGILDGVRGSLEAYQSNIKAKTLLTIASAIAILAASLLVMSFIDSSKLTGALTAITVLFTELFGSMAIFDKISASSGFKSMGKVTRAMVVLSVTLLILAKAVTELAKNDWDDLIKGLLGVAALMAMMVGVSKLMASSSASLIKSSVGLVIFAVAIRLLANSVKVLGEMDTMALVKGMLALIGVLSMLALFMLASKYSGLTAADALGLVATALAVRIIASAIKSLGDMDPGAINAGLIAIGVVLTELGLFTRLVGNGTGLIKTAAALVILGIAMIIFAKAVEAFGSMDLLVLAQGLLGLSVALAAVTAAVYFMPKNMVGIGIGMLAMSAGLVLMAKALETMGGMSVGGIAKGLVTLAAALFILVVATNAMTGALAGAAALLVVTAALLGLSVVMRILGSMGIGEIVKALLALGGVFVVLGAAAAILSPILPAMLLLGAALIVLGIGLAAVGAASLILSIGLSALSVTGLVGVGVLLAIAAAIIPLTVLSPAILVVSAALLVFSIAVIALGVGMTVLSAGLAMLVALGQSGLDALTALAATAASISEFAAELLVAGAALLVFGAGAIVAGAGALVAGIGILALAGGLAVLSTVDISNMEGLGDLAKNLLKASGSLLLASPGLLAGGAALVVFGSGAASTGEGLAKIQNGITEVVKAVKAVPGDMEAATNAIIDGVNTIIAEVTATIASRQAEISSETTKVIDVSVKAINDKKQSFTTAGVNLVNGFISGIQSRVAAAATAAASMAAASLRAANRELDSHSPSRAFEEVGMNADYGFANGLKKYAGSAVKAAQSVAKSTITPVTEMTDGFFSGADLVGQGLQQVAKEASKINPVIDSQKTVIMHHEFDTLHVEGVNDEGEFVAAADYAVEDYLTSIMRRQNRV